METFRNKNIEQPKPGQQQNAQQLGNLQQQQVGGYVNDEDMSPDDEEEEDY